VALSSWLTVSPMLERAVPEVRGSFPVFRALRDTLNVPACDPIERESTLRREKACFDSMIARDGDFNPFADRGWATLARCFAEMVPLSAPLRVLDVGCGTGHSRQLYVPRSSLYIGLDLSLEAVRRSSDRFSSSWWLCADASRIPFAKDAFDVVAFSSVLHHIHDFEEATREAWRVLRPGGYVFAFDPNLLHPAMALFRHPRSPLYSSRGVSPNERPLLPRRLAAALRGSDFVNVQQRCQADIPYRAVKPRLLNLFLGLYNTGDRLLEISGLGRWFGSFVVTAGRKPSSRDGAP